MNRPKTLFIDIDGTLFHHSGDRTNMCSSNVMPLILPGVKEKFNDWDRKGYCIILTTGRKEGDREVTKKQLAYHGIPYDQLVMGITGGERVLINDTKPDSTVATARALVVTRNEGIVNLDI